MTIQDVIKEAQTNTNGATSPRFTPKDWLGWACDSITSALRLDGSLAINSDNSLLPQFFSVDDTTTDFEIPTQFLPFHTALAKYIEWRYHFANPKDDESRKAGVDAYSIFLAAFGVERQQRG